MREGWGACSSMAGTAQGGAKQDGRASCRGRWWRWSVLEAPCPISPQLPTGDPRSQSYPQSERSAPQLSDHPFPWRTSLHAGCRTPVWHLDDRQHSIKNAARLRTEMIVWECISLSPQSSRSPRILRTQVKPRFPIHFYFLWLCRNCEKNALDSKSGKSAWSAHVIWSYF